ncbi:F-type H+-transporting ATPase subunit gamma [Andreprevotia lacus DSM 23236]|jgi:F-type H+-transporting ATPase subunit gamma|uniref:ATP synthase gamma chain n=1 Tax=Andreprevotia lacus DSM 23236 TaxID=1121001 RepID=A0A1W1XCK3_9NEIS|nr:F0F1 ATP synthase subunit gamma [Andreprevotia lacus]SMC21241.1 F-type H+-transporting ATPase subunit gamma [Andreprevotia lacus DSM 23236]
MAGGKEIRTKIKSVKNTQKITRAMEMVATSKMRKAQDRMRAARPYGEKIRKVTAHLAQALVDYQHPFLIGRDTVKRVGIIVVTSDKGLCGGLNTNVLRLALNKMKGWDQNGVETAVTAIGNKGFGFMARNGAKVLSHATGLGDTPHLEQLIGPIKVMVDAFTAGEVDEVHLVYTKFVNTMKQEPVLEQLLPLASEAVAKPQSHEYNWEYLFEPDAKSVIDDLMGRYLEALVYQAVAENIASEQAARMVAMKAATDNADKVIGNLQLLYNKTRQAAITKELSEICAGAAAV